MLKSVYREMVESGNRMSHQSEYHRLLSGQVCRVRTRNPVLALSDLSWIFTSSDHPRWVD